MSRMDESSIITGDINAKQVIKKLSKKYKIELNDDEVEFHIENLVLTKDQKDLIFQILATHFGSVREMHSVTKERVAKLSIIFKRMMTMKGYKIIQFMLTGIMHYNPNLKKLSKKELKSILESDQYAFIEDKYRYAKNLILENNLFRDTLNKLLNSDFQLVDFSMGETFKTINTEKYKVLIIYEFMKLIDDVI